MGTHSIKSQDKEVQPCQENSPISRPRPVASPLPRLAPVLLNLTTSTAVSMLEIGIATRTFPKSSMLSSRTTTESALMPSTLLTWMSTRSLETLIPLLQSTRIRVGRSIDGFGLSPGITKQQRIDVEKLMSSALGKLTDDLAGNYYPLTGMDEAVRQQLV